MTGRMVHQMSSLDVLPSPLRTGCHCRLPQRLRQMPSAVRAQGRPSYPAQPNHHGGTNDSLPSRCSAAQRRRLQPLRAFYDKWLNSDSPEKTRKQYQRQVDQINALADETSKLSDDELRARTADFRRRYDQGESLDNLLVEVFAVVREASDRVLGLRPFDVQLIGGMILHKGQIAEMRTGEGKTLVAILPAVLNALTGQGVHVVTVNDYLARRDSEWVGQVPRFLGLQVGLIQGGIEEPARREAYECDITYVTNSELGFDYLRDNLTGSKASLVLRGFNFCIIDEVDSILIDEARTPLIISGPADQPSEKYYKSAKLAKAMQRDLHYTIDEKQKAVLITDDGYEAAEDVLQVSDLYDPRNPWASYLINAINAKDIQKRDVSYIVRGDQVVIVDEFTGRTMADRRWGEGLHQAVEAKEGLPIQNETITLASITYQNFFRNFGKLAGMTGTALTEIKEFGEIYQLKVSEVPTNRKMAREDNTDVVFRSQSGKWKAVVQEIARFHKKGRPILVGTTSVENSEVLAGMLKEQDIPFRLLNAKPENVERESEIVSTSGRKNAVTIATNMAGRGTDIILGGNAEFMARLKLREMLLPQVVDRQQLRDTRSRPDTGNGQSNGSLASTWAVPAELFPRSLSEKSRRLADEAVKAAVQTWGSRALAEQQAEDRLAFACEKAPTDDSVTSKLREAFQAMESEFRDVCEQEKAKVVGLGGLHVIGTERHESRRIDNQLRGRCGRQGDPGSSRYFLSLEDNMFRVFGGERIRSMMSMFRIDDLPMESKMLTNSLNDAQKKVEGFLFDMRKNLFEYDQVLNTQRDKVYSLRRQALVAPDLREQMLEFSARTMDDILEANVDPSKPVEEWPLEQLASKLSQYCPLMQDIQGSTLQQQAKGGNGFEALRAYLRNRGEQGYFQRVEQVEGLEQGLMQEAQRFFVLTQTDNLWKEHLQAMKFLQQAIRLRGYAQRDPLTEYKLEGFELFSGMMAQIRRNVIYNVYVFSPQKAKTSKEDKKQKRQKKGIPAAV